MQTAMDDFWHKVRVIAETPRGNYFGRLWI